MAIQYNASSVSEVLPVILSDLMEYGAESGSRNGRVRELLNPQIVLSEPWRREVLSHGRKANVFAQIAETMWVLSGRNNIQWLSAYLPRAVDYSDDGQTWAGAYGDRIRRHFGFDQWQNVIDLLARDHTSRRAVISIYDPEVDVDGGKDIPCNDFLQFQSRDGYLHMTVTVRSNDVMWGWSGINAFEWSTMQEITASLLGLNIGNLTFNIGNLHIYEQHWERAKRIEAEYLDYRTVKFNAFEKINSLSEVDLLIDRWFMWEAMCRTGEVTLDLLDDWEEPLFKSWAAATAYFWTQDKKWLGPIHRTALWVAIGRVPASVYPQPVGTASEASQAPATGARTPGNLSDPSEAFLTFATNLHAEKHASYGDSWRKRGEVMSVLANIARKVDRLGVGDSFDTSADTVIDYWVYLAKYLNWLYDAEDTPDNVNDWLKWSMSEYTAYNYGWDCEGRKYPEDWVESTRDVFDRYADKVASNIKHDMHPDTSAALAALDMYDEKIQWVKSMLAKAAPVAYDLWYIENEYKGADADAQG